MRSDEFMNAEEVARYLNLGKNTVYQLAKSGKLASYHVGRKLNFTLEDVEAYVSSTHRAPGKGSEAAPIGPAKEDASDELVQAASFGELKGDPFIIAGGDPSADMIASSMNSSGMVTARKVCGSYTALVHLYAGEADAAVVNLYDQATNACNVPYIRNLAPGVSVVVFRLYGCQEGLIVRSGNPKKLMTWGSLLREDVKLANRAKGSGARVLLDEKLRAMEARAEAIEGYDSNYTTGNIAIRHVASGVADAAIGTEREAHTVSGVQFVPMQDVWVDLVVRKTPESRAAIKRLKDIVASEQLHDDIATLEPCDAGKLGVIVYES